MKKLLSLTVIFLLAQIAFSQGVTIPGTESRQITSSIVAGQEYQLHIMLPGGYANSNKTYPVVYLMDSQWDFPLVTALYGEQYYDGFIPQIIIVGVTWGGKNPNPDSLRARDYTPTNVKGTPQSGGADKFLSFMKEELFPYIEKSYRADKSDRTLVGCSLGGLFTMYALFTHPEMFQRYVAASPAFMWDNNALYQYEKKYAANKSSPPAKLFMCVGGVERSVPAFQKLTEFLNARHYKQLEIEPRVLENTGHSGTKGEGYARGLQFVFKKPSLQLSSTALDKYTGKYQLPDGTTTEIKKENSQLYLYFSPNDRVPLFVSNEKELYSTSQYMNIKLDFDEHKNITGGNVEMFGGSITVKKL
jgi:predicted alpha/beta superfamily hydrolase